MCNYKIVNSQNLNVVRQQHHSQLSPIPRHLEATKWTLSTHGIVTVNPIKNIYYNLHMCFYFHI